MEQVKAAGEKRKRWKKKRWKRRKRRRKEVMLIKKKSVLETSELRLMCLELRMMAE